MPNEKKYDQFWADLKNDLEIYVRDKTALTKIELTENTAKIVAFFITAMIVFLLSFFCIFFASVLLGFYVSEYYGSYTIGFGTVAAAYALLLLLILALKKYIITIPLTNTIIRLIYKSDD